ncbi:MAG: UPF0175 family protein [Anaerolineales bacterium]|nr:UPF0175 family protein [Anaerolineales bacterium]
MDSEKITITLPTAVAQQLATAGDQFTADLIQRGLRDLRIEQALNQYQAGGISFGAAAELAGLPQSELARHAYGRGIEPPFSDETVAEELAI